MKSTPLTISSRGFNKNSVKDAIGSIMSKLKLYKTTPANGLAIFCGYVNSKKITIDLIPNNPIRVSLYRCDNRFHTDHLHEIMENHESYGFIVVKQDTASFHILTGKKKRTIGQFTGHITSKHGRGGQSQNRYQRLRHEEIHNFIKKIEEVALEKFIDPNTTLPNVNGIILAGGEEKLLQLKNNLDKRLSDIILATVHTQYGGRNGFNQAVGLVQDTLSNLKIVQEQKIIESFFTAINIDAPYCFGTLDTIHALECGALSSLILYKDLETIRYTILRGTEEIILYNSNEITSEDTIINEEPLIDWLLDKVETFGNTHLYIISDESEQGYQFVQGFGGLGGILSWILELPSSFVHYDDNEESYYNDFEWNW